MSRSEVFTGATTTRIMKMTRENEAKGKCEFSDGGTLCYFQSKAKC